MVNSKRFHEQPRNQTWNILNMKYRRFRLKYSAPMNSKRWKCNWADCAHGMGLAGNGCCSGQGWWWDASCPGFITHEDLEHQHYTEWRKEIYDIFSSILCHCAEGAEFMTRTELSETIAKEASRGCDLTKPLKL